MCEPTYVLVCVWANHCTLVVGWSGCVAAVFVCTVCMSLRLSDIQIVYIEISGTAEFALNNSVWSANCNNILSIFIRTGHHTPHFRLPRAGISSPVFHPPTTSQKRRTSQPSWRDEQAMAMAFRWVEYSVHSQCAVEVLHHFLRAHGSVSTIQK